MKSVESMENMKKIESGEGIKVIENKNKTKTKTKGGVATMKEKQTEANKKEESKTTFIRTTKIEKSQSNKTIKNLFKNQDKLRFDLAIQRNHVWTIEQKSNLIHSILYGYPIPPVIVQETEDEFIWFLDGKQRLTSIISFINNEFALSKKTPDVYGVEIGGKKFSDLSEDMQDIIYDETITLIKLKNMTDEERDEMFVRWNSGTALSKIELTRAMHSELMEQVNKISELEFFAEDIGLTDKARNRFLDQEIILQIAMLLDEGKENIKGFGSTQVKNYVLSLKRDGRVLSNEIVKKFEDVAHYLNLAVSVMDIADKRKALKKVHIPAVFYTAIKAMENKVRFNEYGEFVKDFLITNYKVDSKYGQSCQRSSSKKENVLIRLNEMEKALDELLKKKEEKMADAV